MWQPYKKVALQQISHRTHPLVPPLPILILMSCHFLFACHMPAGETRETVDMMAGLAVLVEQYLGKQSRAAVSA